MDAHVSVPACTVVETNRMVMIMGTSICHMVLSETVHEVPGMCGVVDGGIIPGLYGYEAGQSGVGDIFAWFVDNAVPPEYHEAAQALAWTCIAYLSRSRQAEARRVLGVDCGTATARCGWTHPERPADATLGTRARHLPRADRGDGLGTRDMRRSRERRADQGAGSRRPAGEEQAAHANLPDVTGREFRTLTAQGPALGSAMHAAVAAGAYPDIHRSQEDG